MTVVISYDSGEMQRDSSLLLCHRFLPFELLINMLFLGRAK